MNDSTPITNREAEETLGFFERNSAIYHPRIIDYGPPPADCGHRKPRAPRLDELDGSRQC